MPVRNPDYTVPNIELWWSKISGNEKLGKHCKSATTNPFNTVLQSRGC